MKPLVPAVVPETEIAIVVQDCVAKWKAGDPALRKLCVGCQTPTEVEKFVRDVTLGELRETTVWKNDAYQVTVRCGDPIIGSMVHLSIKRIDRQPVRDWRDVQDIKNQLVGPECEGVELYPAESRLIDTANQFHLWCVNDPTYRFPFGFNSGRVVTDTSIGNSVNRKVQE